MSSRRCSVVPLASASLLMPTLLAGQIYRVAGGAGNISNTQGLTVGMYEAGRTTSLSAGLAQGFALGFRREVNLGNSSVALGDSSLPLRLPTDIEDYPRTFIARGLLVHMSDPGQRRTISAFTGFTGDNVSNPYFSTVKSSRFVSAMQAQFLIGSHMNLSFLHLSGDRNSALASLAYQRSPLSTFAVTSGWSAGRPVLRLATHQETANRRLDVSYTSGEFRLQPRVSTQSVVLEKVGFNFLASQRIFHRFLVSASRHEYATGDLANNTSYVGVTAGRSQLLEGGLNARFGHLQIGARRLHAVSGTLRSDGSVLITGWSNRLWNVSAIAVNNQSVTSETLAGHTAPTRTMALTLSSAQQLRPRIRLEETVNLAGTSKNIGIGGSYDGDRFSVSATHREIYVPFGDTSGFHQVLLLSLRLHIRDSQVTTAVSYGGGVPTIASVSTDGYYGGSDDASGVDSGTRSHFPDLPKYALTGVVLDAAQQPIRGAAVRAGGQILFTDSEGRFSARYARRAPVQVSLEPGSFLTAQRYSASTDAISIEPSAGDGSPIVLSAAACSSCEATLSPAASGEADHTSVRTGRWTNDIRALAKRLVSRR